MGEKRFACAPLTAVVALKQVESDDRRWRYSLTWRKRPVRLRNDSQIEIRTLGVLLDCEPTEQRWDDVVSNICVKVVGRSDEISVRPGSSTRSCQNETILLFKAPKRSRMGVATHQLSALAKLWEKLRQRPRVKPLTSPAPLDWRAGRTEFGVGKFGQHRPGSRA